MPPRKDTTSSKPSLRSLSATVAERLPRAQLTMTGFDLTLSSSFCAVELPFGNMPRIRDMAGLVFRGVAHVEHDGVPAVDELHCLERPTSCPGLVKRATSGQRSKPPLMSTAPKSTMFIGLFCRNTKNCSIGN